MSGKTCACGCGRPCYTYTYTDTRYGAVKGQTSPFAYRHSQTQEQRFWKHVKRDAKTGCWLWTGSKTPDGYAHFMVFTSDGKKRIDRAHQFAYRTFKGPIPPGLELDHKCSVRSCVNPDHLEAVDHLENCRRGKHVRKTKCNYGHERTPGNTIYFTGRNGNVHRRCLICNRRRAA